MYVLQHIHMEVKFNVWYFQWDVFRSILGRGLVRRFSTVYWNNLVRFAFSSSCKVSFANDLAYCCWQHVAIVENRFTRTLRNLYK